MKTSNILLTSLLGSITVTTLAMMMDIGYGDGDPEYTQYDKQDISLPAFSHIQVRDNHRSVIVKSGSPGAIQLFTMKGNQMPSVTYHLQGDTLVIEQFEDHKQVGAYFTLQVPKNELQGISAVNTEVILNDYQFETMSLSLNKAKVQIYPGDRNNLARLSVHGINHSHVNVSTTIDTLSLNLDQSSIVVDDAIDVLRGSMENSSSLGVRKVGLFEFRKDESSRLDHWN